MERAYVILRYWRRGVKLYGQDGLQLVAYDEDRYRGLVYQLQGYLVEEYAIESFASGCADDKQIEAAELYCSQDFVCGNSMPQFKMSLHLMRTYQRGALA